MMPPSTPFLLRRASLCSSLRTSLYASLLLALPALAQSPYDLIHQVQPGDTLIALAQHYLGDARQWPQLQSANPMSEPRRLRPGSPLRIPMQLLPLGTAQVAFVQGDARISPANGPSANGTPGNTASSAQPAQAGQALAEGSRVQTAGDSFISIRLADGSVIRVQADSQIRIEQLRRRGRAGDAQTILRLERGSVEPSVAPGSSGARRFEIHTPSASTAVRGTRFVVTLDDAGRTLAAVTQGELAVSGQRPSAATGNTPRPLPAGQGLVVQADGQLGPSRSLLAAPNLSALPDPLEDANFLSLPLESVAGAQAYQVQLASDEPFSHILRSATSAATAAGALLRLPALPDGSYYLQARAIDADGLPGQLAQRRIRIKAHPLAPLLLSPAAHAILAQGSAALACSPVAGIQRYRIQVAGSAGFAAPLLDSSDSADCRLSLSTLPPGSYQWRAASLGPGSTGAAPDPGPFSPAQPFAIATRPASTAAEHIQADASGARLQLRWPGEPGQRYRLQLSPTTDFAQPSLEQHLSEPAWTAPALAPGDYYLRLQTQDANGLTSDYSTPRQVSIPAPVRSRFGTAVRSSDGQALSLP